MTTAFQWIFDNAASIGINKSPVVAQTTSRNQTVRATSRGGSIWRFEVEMPGQPWTTARPYITAIEQLDRHSTGTVQINTSGYSSWLSKYQGDADTTSGWTATWTTGNTVTATIPGGANLSVGEVALKAGDWIQLGSSGSVYEVAQDVIYATPTATVTLNRPLIDAAGTASLLIGPAVTWTVICTTMPTWSIVDQNIVTFNGTFSFYEALA